MPEILLVGLFDSAGKDMRRLTVELMEHFRHLLVYLYVGEAMSTLDATPEQIRALSEQRHWPTPCASDRRPTR